MKYQSKEITLKELEDGAAEHEFIGSLHYLESSRGREAVKDLLTNLGYEIKTKSK